MKEVPDYESLYVEGYDKHNIETTLAGRFLQKSHKLLEDTLPANFSADRVLEVGAGSGHHFAHLRHPFSQYEITDNSDAMLEVVSKLYLDEVSSGKIVIAKQDAADLDYPNQTFDRLIATHVLEHILNPVEVLREWDRVVKKGGFLSIVLPCDPGLLWQFGRLLGPRRNSTNLGLPYDYLQAKEHVNAISNLVTFIRYHFESVRESWYPLMVPWADLNLFYICHIQK